ncbi:MAG TPA: S41 family peptidase [Rhodocyclaceae bacterium]|jgi:carboxyl-terminal processing protease|nr:S41 family peptidase [Rhodocyclaceae bacterium]
MRSKLQKFGLIMFGLVTGILLSLNFSANAQKEATAGLPVEELRALADVFGAIKAGYVEPIDDKTLITHAISGMLSNLDPHSAYLDAEAFKDLQISTQGEFGGLGIEVGMEDGFVKVVSPIEDTPAFRAGIKPGDLIVKLDDTPVKGLTLSEAVKKMRGKPKTSIILTIARKGEAKPIVVTLIREVIKVQSVKSKLLDDGIGYVRVTQFQEESVSDLAKHLDRLYKQNKEANKGENLKGLVLDLRNDPGGLLNGAIGVSAAFLPTKTLVVSTKGRAEDANRRYLAAPEDYLRGSKNDPLKLVPDAVKDVPMVVIINGGSASASEIVAGALQDNKRALIVGTQSFGKGSVQTVLPISPTTAIKLTTARYYTPNDRSIQAKGITPDVIVEESANGTSSTRMRLREADLEHHLTNDKDVEKTVTTTIIEKKIKPADKTNDKGNDKAPTKKNKDEDEEDMPRPAFEFGAKNDFQLNQAVNLLKALQVMKR